MNFILAKVGYVGTHSDAARSFAHYGRRISQPRVGAIAVLRRGKRGGHVGVVAGIDAHGNPIIISGNHNRRVGVGVYPRSRVIAYVIPTERRDASAESVPDKVIKSPLAELFAAIANDHERGSPGNRTLPLDPSLAELFGLDQGNAPESPLSRPPS